LKCVIGHDYPAPVVNLEAAAKHARAELWRVKRLPAVKQFNMQILGLLTERENELDEGA